MKLPECEVEREEQLTAFEKACAGLAMLAPFLGLFLIGEIVKWL